MNKLLFPLFFVIFSLPLSAKTVIPNCDSQEVIDGIELMINEDAKENKNSDHFVDLRFIIETAYNAKKSIRVCSGTLTTENGQETLKYKIGLDTNDNSFYIEY
ncbi:hypothetical protein [Pasteurella sp. PK-2025]|uniref:hypothetical protein n=1 Tax=Pasteurella sp. PK-2025 TaxID=3413133 RepID=UPI003C731B09